MNWIIKHGWYFLLIAIAGEIVVPAILAPLYKGYSHMTMALSSLGSVYSPVKAAYSLWMLAAGALFLLSTPALFEAFRKTSLVLSGISSAFVGLFAVGACIFTCFFSVNESKEIITTASKIHGAGSAIGFILLLFVPLLISVLSYKSLDRLTGIVSAVSFVLAMICFVVFIMGDKPQIQSALIAKEGLWQRLNLFFMYLPLAFLAITKIRLR